MPAAGFGNFDPSIIIREGKGSRGWDEDGNEFIDYLTGSGPMILVMGILKYWMRYPSRWPKG
ncbi:MAG: hypothetical protein CM1200mP41_02460 [Gammaproteobacteria bacterium]|nr:MAG: hypothetical protein CM1200mP41_02460 [Gammaproteobacteria bacterium]